jgi:hypothetical protein
MTISIDIIRGQYAHRKNKELQTPAQLRIFLRDAVRENILYDYDAKRRLIAESIIDTMDRIKKARIETDCALNLDQMQKLRYKYSAKDAKQLEDALEYVNDYQNVCAIADSARSRGLNDLGDKASQKAILVGEKKFLSDPGYKEAVKNVRRAIAYIESGFVVKDIESILDTKSPSLIPLGDVVITAMTSEAPDAVDKEIARLVESDLKDLPDALTSAQRNTLNNLDK